MQQFKNHFFIFFILLLGCENAVEKNATTEMEQGLRLVERHKGHYEGYSPQKKRLFSMADMIDASRQLREIQISDPHRPTYHFINPEGRGMPFDPNGSIYWNGRYHMFYIIQDERGHVYGHASSKDLMHWFYHTPALFSKPEDPDKGIYSGNAFITREGKVAMIYHGVDAGNSIALSDHEELLHWEKLKNNPIIPEPEQGSKEAELYSSWDPNGWLENDTYYAIFGGKIPTIFKAKELDSWEYVGPFFSQDMPDVDIEVEDVGAYEYWVTAVDLSGLESDPSNSVSAVLSADEALGLPTEFALNQNYPNPFNPSTQIQYALPEETRVVISIYDLMGRKVRTLVNDVQDAGYRSVMWNATNDMGRLVSAGVYIYSIQAGDFIQNRKMVLMK